MPFKSEKQRKWMHENEPEMAKEWEKEYKEGGSVSKDNKDNKALQKDFMGRTLSDPPYDYMAELYEEKYGGSPRTLQDVEDFITMQSMKHRRNLKESNKSAMSNDTTKQNKAQGGVLNGPSHESGGIPIEAEGGEFIIKKDSVNRSTLDMLEYVNKHGDLPMSNAKNRRSK